MGKMWCWIESYFAVSEIKRLRESGYLLSKTLHCAGVVGGVGSALTSCGLLHIPLEPHVSVTCLHLWPVGILTRKIVGHMIYEYYQKRSWSWGQRSRFQFQKTIRTNLITHKTKESKNPENKKAETPKCLYFNFCGWLINLSFYLKSSSTNPENKV